MAFREDESRNRDETTALNFAWFRKVVLPLLAKDGTNMSNRKKMYRNSIGQENVTMELGWL